MGVVIVHEKHMLQLSLMLLPDCGAASRSCKTISRFLLLAYNG